MLENGIGRVLITDFGLARAADDASITRTGLVAGTPHYMSPEQANGDAVDHRSDLFSLGSVMYFMATGRTPFRAQGTMAVLHAICHKQQRSVLEINAKIPPPLDLVISKLLKKQPDHRFDSAAELRTLLARYLAHLQDPLRKPLPTSLRPSWTWYWACLAGVAAVSISLGLFAIGIRFMNRTNGAVSATHVSPEADSTNRDSQASSSQSEFAANEGGFDRALQSLASDIGRTEATWRGNSQAEMHDTWEHGRFDLQQAISRLEDDVNADFVGIENP